jgi:tRNA threonylcarbamoyladenosine biosynthesis protein TsaE
MTKLVSHSVEETEAIGRLISKSLKGTEIIALYGGLGAGKTAFTRGIVTGLGMEDCVSSPTFSIVNEYLGDIPVYHFDMYRIDSWDDLYSIGFFEYIDNGVLIIEWSENIEGALPDDYIKISISYGNSDNERIFEIEGLDIEDTCI